MKRLIALLIIFANLFCLTVLAGSASKVKTIGISVNVPTPKQIAQFMQQNPILAGSGKAITFDKAPLLKKPFNIGKISNASLNEGLNAVNAARYIAGIPSNVVLNPSYNEACQTGSFINALNGEISHFPNQPAEISEALYNKGSEACSNSNLASGFKLLSESVLEGYMNDGDSGNISALGHRRWVLSPVMKKTGFGAVTGNYSSMYALDNRNGDYADKYKISAWPAQNMPSEFFGKEHPFSLIYDFDMFTADRNSVTVKMTRLSDGKVWTFNKNSPSNTKSATYFNVNNEYISRGNCIIWRTGDITSYNPGDIYSIQISGIKKYGKAYPVSYNVSFFSLNKISKVVTPVPKISYYTMDKERLFAGSEKVKISWFVDKACKFYMKVYDSNEKLVANILNPASLKSSGNYYATWNGCDANGKPLTDGDYRIDAIAVDTNGSSRTISKDITLMTPFIEGGLPYMVNSVVSVRIVDNDEYKKTGVGWPKLIMFDMKLKAEKNTYFNFIIYNPDGTRNDEVAEGYTQTDFAMSKDSLISESCPNFLTSWPIGYVQKGVYRLDMFFCDENYKDYGVRSLFFTIN